MADKIEALSRARHKCVNKIFKKFSCLRTIFRHNRTEHYQWFTSCILIVKLMIEDEDEDSTLWIEYKKL